jgi:hypothetical protein
VRSRGDGEGKRIRPRRRKHVEDKYRLAVLRRRQGVVKAKEFVQDEERVEDNYGPAVL